MNPRDRRPEHGVRCGDCQTMTTNGAAHVVKASNPSGRAWRCDPCNAAEVGRLWAFNQRQRNESFGPQGGAS